MSNLTFAELQAIAKGLRAKLQKHGYSHYSATTVKTLVVRDVDHFENAADISYILYAFEQLCDNGNAELQERVVEMDAHLAESESRCAELQTMLIQQQHEIQQILGKALGYPVLEGIEHGPTGEDVIVGDHTAESLAMEAAERIQQEATLLGELHSLNELHGELLSLNEQLLAYRILEPKAGSQPIPTTYIRKGVRIYLDYTDDGGVDWKVQRMERPADGSDVDLTHNGESHWPTAQQATIAALRAGWLKLKEQNQ